MQRWLVTGLLLAGLTVSGALGGRLMRQGGAVRHPPATAARPCEIEAPIKVASGACPMAGSDPDATCAVFAGAGD